MNKVILVGRITKDPELKKTNSDIPYVQFTIAVNRLYQNKNGDKQADFINCVAWRNAAELLARYIKKGSQIGVEGQIQTRNYDDQNGVRHFITEVVCDNIHFLESKKPDEQANTGIPYNDYNQQGFNQPSYNQPTYNQSYNKPNNYGNQYNQPNQRQFGQPNNSPFKSETPNRVQPKQTSPFDDIDSQFDISSDDLPF